MALEIERKYLDADHEALRRRLADLDAVRIGAWFESNAVYDDASRTLKAQGTLLRHREKQGRHVLTLKRKSDTVQHAGVKVYDEHETDVADGSALRAILTGLGYAPAFRYEKIREKWRLHDCDICLDTLPFGSYLEIEGSEADIEACAAALELLPQHASTATYHELNRQYRAQHGLGPEESFVFPEGKASALRKELALHPLDRKGEGA
jgi:adenylate cyclase, class 2